MISLELISWSTISISTEIVMNEKKLKVSNYLLPCLVTHYLVPQTSNRIFQSIFRTVFILHSTVCFFWQFCLIFCNQYIYVHVPPVIVVLSSHQPHLYRGEAIYQISIHILCVTWFTYIYRHTHPHFMQCSMDLFWFQDTSCPWTI
jgi:hypothetical protein